MAHLSQTGIVQSFDKGCMSENEFRLALIRWLCDATESELDIVAAELLDGFDGSGD
jgi:hypothetical protein